MFLNTIECCAHVGLPKPSQGPSAALLTWQTYLGHSAWEPGFSIWSGRSLAGTQ